MAAKGKPDYFAAAYFAFAGAYCLYEILAGVPATSAWLAAPFVYNAGVLGIFGTIGALLLIIKGRKTARGKKNTSLLMKIDGIFQDIAVIFIAAVPLLFALLLALSLNTEETRLLFEIPPLAFLALSLVQIGLSSSAPPKAGEGKRGFLGNIFDYSLRRGTLSILAFIIGLLGALLIIAIATLLTEAFSGANGAETLFHLRNAIRPSYGMVLAVAYLLLAIIELGWQSRFGLRQTEKKK